MVVGRRRGVAVAERFTRSANSIAVIALEGCNQTIHAGVADFVDNELRVAGQSFV